MIFPIKMFWYIAIIFKAFHFLKLLFSGHHIGSQDTIILFEHVKLLALKLDNFSFSVHSVVQGHFNGATRRRTTPSKDRVPRAVGRSDNIGGHCGNFNLRHFEGT